MIHTVFCAPGDADQQWQSELLGLSWGRVRQPGELIRLVSGSPGDLAPCHPSTRDVRTMSWSPHPYTGDSYPPYQKPAALLEWLFLEPIEGTILLVEPTSVFRAAVSEEVGPGEAKAAAWPDLPRGEGPFGLGPDFEFLAAFCVDRTLELPAVALPVLIHSRDLRKIVARWLELMSIIRAETAGKAQVPAREADRIAYAIAAAEARIPHTVTDLALTSEAPDTAALAELQARRARRLDRAFHKPSRQKGVREGKILGSLFLEIPGRPDTVSLNSSGAAIWEACDGNRSLAEINRELERRFDMSPGSLQADVEVVIKRLESIGALRLDQA